MIPLICFALLIGLVAGLRAFTAPALASWAAYAGILPVSGTWLGFLTSPWAVLAFTLMALGEFVTDLLPSTPSRTVPVQLTGRLTSGAFVGAAVGVSAGMTLVGSLAGLLGAFIGAYGGKAARAGLARAFDSDSSAAVLEDTAAVVLGLCAVGLL